MLTAAEIRHVRATLRNAAVAYGGFDVLAEIMGVPVGTLYSSTKKCFSPSGLFVIRLAAAARISVEAVLTGELSAAGRCPTCGHRVGDGRIVAGGAR